MFLKKFVEIFFLVILVGGIVYIWHRVPVPCATPLQYSIGEFDAKFGLSQEEFLKQVAISEKPWEESLGHDLFVYSPQAPFKINLIFDERQQRTIDQQKLEGQRSSVEKTQAGIKATQDKLLASFKVRREKYESDLTAFEGNLKDYNSRIEYWNSHGGAPADEYKKLQAEKKKLGNTQSTLERERQMVNNLANQINSYSKKSVATVEDFNTRLQGFMEEHGTGHEDFDEGVYTGTAIDIYQFDDEVHLQAVLTHEFGHWMGLDHVTNPASIMYPQMGAQDLTHLTLSSEDRAELSRVCSESRFDIFKTRLILLGERLHMLYASK